MAGPAPAMLRYAASTGQRQVRVLLFDLIERALQAIGKAMQNPVRRIRVEGQPSFTYYATIIH
jgi:hypothetical protein